MSDTTVKIPGWYKAVVIILILWNLMGIFSFYMHVFISDETLAALPEDQAALYDQYPMWSTILFGIATVGGLLGSLGLFLLRKWAKPVLIISLIAVLIQMTHNVFFTDSMAVYGVAQAVTMPILVILIAIYEVMLVNRAIKSGWIA